MLSLPCRWSQNIGFLAFLGSNHPLFQIADRLEKMSTIQASDLVMYDSSIFEWSVCQLDLSWNLANSFVLMNFQLLPKKLIKKKDSGVSGLGKGENLTLNSVIPLPNHLFYILFYSSFLFLLSIRQSHYQFSCQFDTLIIE